MLLYNSRIIQTFKKNERTCRDIKTTKVHEQDWDGNLATQLY